MDSRRGPDLEGSRFSMKRIFSAGNTLTAPPSPVASSRRAGAIHSATPPDRYKFSTPAKKCKHSSHRTLSKSLVQCGSSPPSERLEWRPKGGENRLRNWFRVDSCHAMSPYSKVTRSDVSRVLPFGEDRMTWRRR